MMRRKKAITLLELIIAMALLTVMTATTTTSFISIKSLRQNFLNREAGFAQANLAVATVFERALRTGGAVGVSAFTIQPDGRMVELRRLVGGTTVNERIWFDSATHEVKYRFENDPDKVILRGVQNLWFSNDYTGPSNSRRLALELTLQDGQKLRTSVQPRNQRTPQAVIN